MRRPHPVTRGLCRWPGEGAGSLHRRARRVRLRQAHRPGGRVAPLRGSLSRRHLQKVKTMRQTIQEDGEPARRENRAVHANADRSLEDFAAELTVAAYSIALRNRAGETWLELQLELWQVLTETVKKRSREPPCTG